MVKKRIIRITVFLIIFALLFAVCSSAFKTNSDNTRIFKGMYAEQEDTIDVLFVGASCMKTNFVCPIAYRDYGFTSYTFGLDGMCFELMETMTAEVLERQSPKVVLVDLRTVTIDFTNQKARTVIDHMKWSDNKKSAIEKFRGEDSDVSFYLTLDKYHSRWQDLGSVLAYYYFLVDETIKCGALNEYGLKEILFDSKHPLKGFYTSAVTTEINMYKSFAEVSEEVRVSESTEKALNGMMDFAEEKGINLVFLISPMAYSENIVENEKSPQKINYAKKLVEERGFECIDYRSEEFLNEIELDYSKDFGDYRHLNINGALKATDHLAGYLAEKYDLPDHRNDDEYDNEWQKSVKCMETLIDYCQKNMTYK